MLPSRPRDNRDPQVVKVLTNWLFELEKLHENKLIAHDLVASNQWNRSLWSHNRFIETKFQFGDCVLWFPKTITRDVLKFQRRWFGPCWIQYYLRNNVVLFITIDKFDPNLVLVNINKSKPYIFIENKTLQPILVKMVTWSLTNLFKPKNLYHY
jgi:hypothetical protein